jgi:nickel/cobalt exporter
MDIASLALLPTASLPVLLGSAFAMGALHGLEPGHSKTMMAAFIIAVHGTPIQAVVLGLSAALSHSAIVWILGLSAAAMGEEWVPESLESWFMLLSGLSVVGVGCWILIRMIAANEPPCPCAPGDTACEDACDAHEHEHEHDHEHGHDHPHPHGLGLGGAHALAHAREIENRFSSGHASLGQTVAFGLSGGLIPCPAAITVLILCLHLGKLGLGFAVVSAFSLGLALTLVMVGVISALGLRAARHGLPGLDAWLSKTPYLSGGLILIIGLAMIVSGWNDLSL